MGPLDPEPDDARPETPRRWLRVSYAPVSLFSLRMTHATSKGGKTLLAPSPYTVKMALLDACFRLWEGPQAEIRAREVFDWIKARPVRVLPPAECVVQQTFSRVLDAARDKSEGPFRRTIAYREFVWYGGRLELALGIDGLEETAADRLSSLFAVVNCFGKRGGFFQFQELLRHNGPLPTGFTQRRRTMPPAEAAGYLVTQAFDDFGEALCRAQDGFDRVNTYGKGVVKLGQHRILELTAIPYRRESADRRHTWYRRSTLPPEDHSSQT